MVIDSDLNNVTNNVLLVVNHILPTNPDDHDSTLFRLNSTVEKKSMTFYNNELLSYTWMVFCILSFRMLLVF